MRYLVAFVAFIALASVAYAADDSLVVHEWGTFTSLQDETGKALGAINEDAEPLPDFVHRLLPDERGPKGYPTSQAVTMRLETPVVYFHLPAGAGPMNLSFSAEFHGGLLTQFYPDAATNFIIKHLEQINASTLGRLEWTNLTVGPPARGPATNSHVWLAPRNVKAADVTASNGEAERYLFYRGVGHVDAPVSVVRKGQNLQINGRFGDRLWYFDSLPNGKCAFRKVESEGNDEIGNNFTHTPATFDTGDYDAGNLAKLREQLKPALVGAGLFDDEADAMLNTWEESYFKSPGTRVFFIVPRSWVDQVLPIKLSVPARIERVMVGRIDLVTPKQHELARWYLSLPDKNSQKAQELLSGLGRFAKAIVANEQARHPAPAAEHLPNAS